jgi:uncharacterized membrane protein YbaN (DUF454 family)
VYRCLGGVCVGVGAAGVVLPGLPTTPFLLLASFFFVRSSPTLHAWLVRSRVFGPFLRDWERHRGVRPRTKALAVAVLAAGVGATALFGNLPWPLLAAVLALALVGLTVILRLPTVREPRSEHKAEA